ncbi:MAG TPA: adenylosuccinate synthase [Thermoplasmata archaeon]|nr:adenylosuccinate synthase [Thermoplasmata archaeon]
MRDDRPAHSLVLSRATASRASLWASGAEATRAIYPHASVVREGNATTVRVIVGAQFGDEAKGKISDFLAADTRYVVRTGGGPNAGHSIHLPEGALVLHQLACGVLRHGVVGVSGPGMVIQPFKLDAELQELERRGLLRGEVLLSDRAHVILPVHEREDVWEDELRASKNPRAALGTTKSGIGPAYSDRSGRWGIRLGDLARPAQLRERLELLYAAKPYLSDLPAVDELTSQLVEVGSRLAPMIQSTEPILWDALARHEPVLLEGAQSALLDVDFGTYPFVTSSHPTSAGALLGSGIPPTEVDEVIGVAKAYCTRVGEGPFPTEDSGERGEFLRRVGGERGATTGRPRRCGWLDLVMLRYGARLNGFTGLAITKVDVLGGLEEIPVCTHYVMPDGATVRDVLPTHADDLANAQPVYEIHPGWPEFHQRLKDRVQREGAAALPSTLRRYIDRIVEETGVPVQYVGYGPDRSETVALPLPSGPAHRAPIAPWTG